MPEDQGIVFTLLTVVIWGALYGVLTLIVGLIVGLFALSTAMVGAATTPHYYDY